MGILDFIGEAMGKQMARVQEATVYKSQYEHMNNYELRREYDDLKRESEKFLCSEDVKHRLMAVKMIMDDRHRQS